MPNFYRIVAGFKGEIIKDYNYEVALNSSRDELTFKNPEPDHRLGPQ